MIRLPSRRQETHVDPAKAVATSSAAALEGYFRTAAPRPRPGRAHTTAAGPTARETASSPMITFRTGSIDPPSSELLLALRAASCHPGPIRVEGDLRRAGVSRSRACSSGALSISPRLALAP